MEGVMCDKLKSVSAAIMLGLVAVVLSPSPPIPGLYTSANMNGPQDPQGEPPKTTPPIPDLIVAVRQGNTPKVKSLLSEGADPNVMDRFGRSKYPAWGWALLVDSEDSFKAFLEKGINTEPEATAMAFRLAASRGKTAVAKIFLDKGASADITFGDRPTALMLAAGSGNLELVKLLLAKGANPNLKGRDQDTPLMFAARAGSVSVVNALLEKAAEIDAVDKDGQTALMWAARTDNADVVRTLLVRNASVDGTNKSGRSALSMAADRANAEMVKLLRSKGAKGDVALGKGTAESPTVAVNRSLPLLQRGAALWLERSRSGCISCHHQGMIVRTTALAQKSGFKIDEPLAQRQLESILHEPRRAEMRKAQAGVDDRLRVDFDGNLSLRTGLFLSELLDVGYKPDIETESDAKLLADLQWVDGRWNHGLPRIPIESSDFAATAFAVRVLPAYAAKELAADTANRVARARTWLLINTPNTTDDEVFRLFGLKWSQADPKQIKQAVQQLLAEQRPSGGWGQIPELTNDAYSTGLVLVALHQAGVLPVTSRVFQRGVKYLLRTQEEDGSWFVPTRSLPANPFFESGYPHGKFQFISFAGSCWATMALIHAASSGRH
jgi:ankyrin repeat protein